MSMCSFGLTRSFYDRTTHLPGSAMALTLACQSLGFTAPLAPMRSGAVRMVALDEPSAAPAFSVMDMPGISGPLGFFDPMVPHCD